MMALGYPNLVDAATVSGGDWLAGLPAANVQDRSFAAVARSTDALAASTKIRLDHGSAKSVRVLCIAGHNLSSAATIVWNRGTSAGGSEVYAGSSVNAWQIVPQAYEGRDYNVIIVLSQAYSARYDTIEITDTANAAGYVEIGRFFIGALYQPTYNASYGLQDGIEDLSAVDRSDGGALWTTQRRKLRTVQMVLEGLSLTAGDTLHDMQMSLGTTEEVLYVPDLSDPAINQRYGFLATASELSALEYPYWNTRQLPLKLKQVA